MKFWADLHMHTTCSDGSMLPSELLLHAQKMGLKGISITDHDTLSAYCHELMIQAKELKMCLGSGVEFSCHFQGYSLHILGYDFDISSHEMHNLCHRHQQRRENRNRLMLEKLQKQGITISYDELQHKARGISMGRLHLAQVMVERHHVETIREAFHVYIGEKGSCYIQGELFDVEEAIEVIHRAKGKAFIAHPHFLSKEFPLERLLELSFDGIEACYAQFQSKKWIKIAKTKRWLISGGSDFHGESISKVGMGCNGVDQTMFNKIFEKPLVV